MKQTFSSLFLPLSTINNLNIISRANIHFTEDSKKWRKESRSAGTSGHTMSSLCFCFVFPSYITDLGLLKPTTWKWQETQTKNTATKTSVLSLCLSLSLTRGPGRRPPSKTDNNCAIPAKQGRKNMTPPPPWSVKAKEALDNPLPSL